MGGTEGEVVDSGRAEQAEQPEQQLRSSGNDAIEVRDAIEPPAAAPAPHAVAMISERAWHTPPHSGARSGWRATESDRPPSERPNVRTGGRERRPAAAPAAGYINPCGSRPVRIAERAIRPI